MVNDSYFRFDDDNKIYKVHILTIITGELGKLKTHSPIYWIKDDWENCLNLRHTLGIIYLTSILVVQCLQMLQNTIMLWWVACKTNSIASINSFWSGDTIWWQRSGSTLAQAMACCTMAPHHYLNQCWLIISKLPWHSYKGSFTRDASTINH